MLLDNKLGTQMFDGEYVHHGLLKLAIWLLDQESKTLKKLWIENGKEYEMVFAGHSLGSGVAALSTVIIVNHRDKIGGIPRSNVRCYSIAAPVRCMSLNLAVKYADVTHSVVAVVEGCPTVFQAVCNLTPGYYQYKFCVDGEWRHDHYQPNATTPEYGTVNAVILTLKPDNVPAILSPDVVTGSSMDVDNEAFQHVVRIYDGTFCEAVPRISEADLEHSRQIVSKFLSNHTVYELLPESGKVIAFDVELPVKQAFHILYEQGCILTVAGVTITICSAPFVSLSNLSALAVWPTWVAIAVLGSKFKLARFCLIKLLVGLLLYWV